MLQQYILNELWLQGMWKTTKMKLKYLWGLVVIKSISRSSGSNGSSHMFGTFVYQACANLYIHYTLTNKPLNHILAQFTDEKLKLREVQYFAHDHSANKCWNKNLTYAVKFQMPNANHLKLCSKNVCSSFMVCPAMGVRHTSTSLDLWLLLCKSISSSSLVGVDELMYKLTHTWHMMGV